MFSIDVSWSDKAKDGQLIDDWARANCHSFVVPKFRVVRTSTATNESSSRFEFTDEADAIIFALKWK
jgi:hypothetical protein